MYWLSGKKDKEVVKEKLIKEEHEIQGREETPSINNEDDKCELSDDDRDCGTSSGDSSLNSDESSENKNDDDDDEDEDDDADNESMTTDDDISIIVGTSYDNDDNSIDLFSSDDDDDNEQVSLLSAEKDISNNSSGQDITTNENPNQKKIKDSNNGPTEIDEIDKEENDDEDFPTSFWEKQSLLVLAAEHDRVDVLKTLLADENDEKDKLMNSGIPPLHLAITFGSVNTAQTLLRMGADPSVRPDIDMVLEVRKNQPEDSKVDIPNIRRFDSITAWELAFGNKLYEEKSMSKSAKSWSMFGSATPAVSEDTKSATARVIKPVDMAPSKREGIRHAFTAEALRSIGSDEVERLKQLLAAGMPANIELGGKDLYGWAVEMGSLNFHCEELLRPHEAAKYETNINIEQSQSAKSDDENKSGTSNIEKNRDGSAEESEQRSSSFVVHRPDAEETIPQLNNRLDELESLATALSICLDNVAEEVSVCHGLLLMGGGASTLASHVKSLRVLKEQKLYELEDAEAECQDIERELFNLVQSTGDIGKEIANISNFNVTILASNKNNDDLLEEQETEADCLNIKTQIAASENKVSICNVIMSSYDRWLEMHTCTHTHTHTHTQNISDLNWHSLDSSITCFYC